MEVVAVVVAIVVTTVATVVVVVAAVAIQLLDGLEELGDWDGGIVEQGKLLQRPGLEAQTHLAESQQD